MPDPAIEGAVTVPAKNGGGDPVDAAEQAKSPMPFAPQKRAEKPAPRLVELEAEKQRAEAEQKRLDEEIAAEAQRVAGTGAEPAEQIEARYNAFKTDARLSRYGDKWRKIIRDALKAAPEPKTVKYTAAHTEIFADLIGLLYIELDWNVQRRGELEARVAALETRDAYAIDYRGLWQPGKYPVGAFVTFDGSLWRSKAETEQKPGDGPAWNLVVARGKPGPKGKR